LKDDRYFLENLRLAAPKVLESCNETNNFEQVAARVDSVDKLLVAHDFNHRDKTLKDVAAAAQARVRVARGKLVTANIVRVCQLHTPR
jgi:hypothetical protein